MRLKLFAFLTLLLTLTTLSIKPTLASEKPSQEITISEEVYADLALRHALDHVSVYYFDDNIANTVSINAQKNWVPASTIKLFAAMYAYDQVERGKISLDQLITIDDKNVAPSESDPTGYSPLQVGDTVSVFRLVDQMITQSDNTAFNTLLDLLDRREITKYIHDLGLVNSNIGGKLNLDDTQQQYEVVNPGYGENVTTADDYAKAFILINGGRIPGSAGLFNILSRQKLNSMIPAFLPPGVTVAHKTGELDPYYHDGGIVVGPGRRYILSVFSDTGDPSVVAHISKLIYTKDVNLIGSETPKGVGEEPLPPVDPLVEAGEPQNVLAESTQNVSIPTVNAADIGITSSDLSHPLGSRELPKVIFPPDSPLHFLVDLGDKLTTNLNPIPSLKVAFEVGNLKLKLAEANDLIAKGRKDEANTILREIDTRLSAVASQKSISQNLSLQTSIDQVSETRFSILKNELSSLNQTEKVAALKEIARQAKRTIDNVKPYIGNAIKTKELSQKPVVGEVVKSTPNSVTIKTADNKEVTVPVDSQITTRDINQTSSQVENITQIKTGTTIALAGFSSDKGKPSFILKNIASDSASPKPVTVIKVNLDTNTLVVASGNGAPVQVDLTKQSVIKGVNTNISLNQVKKGDVIVVRGEPIIPPANNQLSPSAAPLSTTEPANQSQNTNTPSQSGQTQQSPSPRASSLPTTPGAPSGKSGTTTTPLKKSASPAPQVIKGSVIQVVEKASDTKPVKKSKEEKKQPVNPVPSATPASKEEKK